jgi:hypothetical protein
MIRTKYAAWPILSAALLSPLLIDCGAVKDLQQAASGCDELDQGPEATAQLDVDANVKAFVLASAELKAVAKNIKTDVKAACVDICKRLNVADTWSAIGDDDASISNAQGTGACDKAGAEIDVIMREVKATANFALLVTAPICTVDTQVQAACESTCHVDAVCKPGEIDVVTRCEPAKLSVQCQGTCNVNAVCEGTAEVSTQCEGTCDATCQGSCAGTCMSEAGTPMDAATCNGKCTGTCKGTCTGECHVTAQAGISCGASASCRGGCTGSFTAPKCETELKALPPECHADATCQTSCSSRARSHVQCTQPKVVLVANVAASAKIPALKAAIETNFPRLIVAARAQGPIVQRALADMAASGTAVVNGASSLGGKSVACAAAAAQVAASASVSVNVSVQGSAKVHESCTSNEH